MEIKKANLKFAKPLTKRSVTKEIILHCTASKEGVNFGVEAVHKLHLKNGWSGIGYNYLIDLNGDIWEGRPEDCVGAHVSGHNSKSIGVCYTGGLDKNGKPKDTRNEKQLKSMTELCRYLHKKYPNATFHGHYEFDNKACPCFKVKEWIASIDIDGTQTPEQQTAKTTEQVAEAQAAKATATQSTDSSKPSVQKTEQPKKQGICCNIISHLKQWFS